MYCLGIDGTAIYDYNKRLILLSVIQLSGGHSIWFHFVTYQMNILNILFAVRRPRRRPVDDLLQVLVVLLHVFRRRSPRSRGWHSAGVHGERWRGGAEVNPVRGKKLTRIDTATKWTLFPWSLFSTTVLELNLWTSEEDCRVKKSFFCFCFCNSKLFN